MTKPALLLLQSLLVRIASARRTQHDLQALQHSVTKACRLSSSTAWDRRAAAHADFHRLVAEATGAPEFALLARLVSGSMQLLIEAAGPSAEDLIVASRRRLLSHLEAGDADRAAQEMADHLTQLGCAPTGTACG
jgi:GntR family transcriptional regulator, transcriptional repressor for pyruvate dehydrogenase complex